MSHKTAKILAIIITISLYIITLSAFLLVLYIGLNSVDGLMESFNLKDFVINKMNKVNIYNSSFYFVNI